MTARNGLSARFIVGLFFSYGFGHLLNVKLIQIFWRFKRRDYFFLAIYTAGILDPTGAAC
jgi:hypothetical protein